MSRQAIFKIRFRSAGGVLALLTLFAASSSLHAIECPVAHATTTRSATKESKQRIKEYARLMAKQGRREVPMIVASLKKRYPKASDAEITNYLVTLYCPVLDKNDALSDEQKTNQLTTYSSQLMRELAKP